MTRVWLAGSGEITDNHKFIAAGLKVHLILEVAWLLLSGRFAPLLGNIFSARCQSSLNGSGGGWIGQRNSKPQLR